MNQAQRRLVIAVGLIGPAVAMLALCLAASRWTGVPFEQFTRDPAAIMGANPLNGVVSNLGVLLWCATATLCFFLAMIEGPPAPSREERRLFYLGAGALSAILLFDDLFQLHDWLAPVYLGADEVRVFAVYGALALGYLVAFRRRIGSTNPLFLALAGGFFAASLIVDRFPEELLPVHHLFEDGTKFLGIACWLAYFLDQALTDVDRWSRGEAYVAPSAIERPGKPIRSRSAV